MSEAPLPNDTLQPFGTLQPVQIGLDTAVRHRSVSALNRLLAATLAIRDLYQKSHWHTSGPTFSELHVMFGKHYDAQAELADELAERVQTLGGVALALPEDVVSESQLARAPRGRESVRNQLERLASAHESVLIEARPLARIAAADGDDGTNDLIVSQLVRLNEQQCWFVTKHLAVEGAQDRPFERT